MKHTKTKDHLVYMIWTCIALLMAGVPLNAIEEAPKEERVFVIHAPIRNLDDYRKLAEQAVRLKPFGRVEMNISSLAEKGFHDVPEGRNFWYEYTSYNPTPYKFFPDPKIAPYIPEEFVRKNRELLLAKREILRENGLGAAFWSYEPNYLPEAFFETYPHMRGARVDHPEGEIPRLLHPVSVCRKHRKCLRIWSQRYWKMSPRSIPSSLKPMMRDRVSAGPTGSMPVRTAQPTAKITAWVKG